MQCVPHPGVAAFVFVHVNRYSPMPYEPDNIFLGRAMLDSIPYAETPISRFTETLPLPRSADTPNEFTTPPSHVLTSPARRSRQVFSEARQGGNWTP